MSTSKYIMYWQCDDCGVIERVLQLPTFVSSAAAIMAAVEEDHNRINATAERGYRGPFVLGENLDIQLTELTKEQGGFKWATLKHIS